MVVVFGYGCHLVPELRGYLDRIVRFCDEQKPDGLIFCGGYTQRKSAPGMSEAQLMADYVLPQLTYPPELQVKEDESYTTLDNAKNVSEIIQLVSPEKLTVFCETQRALKVDHLVRRYWHRRANIETASWELMSPLKQFISTLYEILAAYFPPLAWFFHYRRVKRAEQI